METCELSALQQEELQKQIDAARIEKEEAATAAYFQQVGIKPCPQCTVWIEKISGCKYVTCSSGTCRGLTFLCMDCGKKLEGDHANHPCP